MEAEAVGAGQQGELMPATHRPPAEMLKRVGKTRRRMQA